MSIGHTAGGDSTRREWKGTPAPAQTGADMAPVTKPSLRAQRIATGASDTFATPTLNYRCSKNDVSDQNRMTAGGLSRW